MIRKGGEKMKNKKKIQLFMILFLLMGAIIASWKLSELTANVSKEEKKAKKDQVVIHNKAIKYQGKRVFMKICVAESLWLLGPIRMYTAISLREACALTWGNESV